MKRRLPFKLAGIVGLILLAAESSWAADAVQLPGAAQPSTVGAALKQQQQGQQNQLLPPQFKKPEQPTGGLGEQAKKIKFQLNGIILEGNHVYSTAQLRPLYADDLHKTISVYELFQIVQRITNYYRNNGYILSRAVLPPQHVKGGVVRVRIIEGYIGKVDVTGQPYGARCMVQVYGNKIKECPPLEISRMEKYLLLANELPATTVRAVLTPSKKEVGAADLDLVTQNSPVTGYVSYDTYGTRYIGPQQISANLALNSWLGSGDQTQFTVTKTPKGGELMYTDVNYSTPISDEGIRWSLGYTRVHTHPLFVLRVADIDGLNDNYYTMLYFPIIRERTKSLTLRAGINYLDSTVTTLSEPLYADHIRTLDLGGTYNWSDTWYGSNLVSGDIRQGLPILGYTSNQNPDTAQTSRPGARGDYSKIMLTLSRLQAIYGPISLYALAMGQTSCNPLLAAEQFTFGGSQIGRGYDVAELIGDKGIAGSVELRYDKTFSRFIQDLQFYAFYDAGEVWDFKFLGGVPRKINATSAGVGMRFFFTRAISGNVMWAQPLTKFVDAEQFIHAGWRPRVFFSVVASLD